MGRERKKRESLKQRWSRRTVAALLIPLCVATLPSGSAEAYDVDHYFLTYYLALSVGFTARQSYQIASGAMALDYDPDTAPLPTTKAQKLAIAQGTPPPHIVTIWLRYHAFDDINLRDLGRAEVERAKQEQKDRLRDLGVAQKNPGPLLHYVQDYYPHFGWESARGHVFAGHLPDFLDDSHENRRGATLESIMELTRFRTEMGEPARIYDVNRVFEVLEKLSAANPIRDQVPASAVIRDRSPDELEYSEHLVKDLTNILIDAAKTGIGWHDVFLLAVKQYGYYPDLFNIALDLAKSPISLKSHTVINTAIDEDVYAGRLLWHPEGDCNYQLPVDYIGYNYDREAWVISPVYPIESVEFEFLEPRVTFGGAPGSSSGALVATVEAPYKLSGILPIPNLGGQLSVRETFKIDQDFPNTEIDRHLRGNGSFSASRQYRKARSDFEAGVNVTVTVHVCGFPPQTQEILVQVPPEDEPRVAESQPSPATTENSGGWDDAVADGERDTESDANGRGSSTAGAGSSPTTSPSVPVVPEESVADAARRTSDRVRQDQERDREVAGDLADALGGLSDALGGGSQPPVRAPVQSAGDPLPGEPGYSSGSRTPQSGQPQQPTGSGGTQSSPTGSQNQPPSGGNESAGSCVIQELPFGNDGHFLVRAESGYSGDATAYQVWSVPGEKTFADGSGCRGERSCLDFYMRQTGTTQLRTTVMGYHQSKSSALKAARKACPSAR